DRNQSAHDMGVTVAAIFQQRLAIVATLDAFGQPDLADTALHLVGWAVFGFWHRLERSPEFDDIPVAVVPVVQKLEILPDLVDRHRVPYLTPNIGLNAAESDITFESEFSGLSRRIRGYLGWRRATRSAYRPA